LTPNTPGHKKLLLLLAHVQVVTVVNVKIGPGNLAPYVRAWFNPPLLEVGLKVTLAVNSGLTGKHPKSIVAPVSVDLSD
jgi:hypothetical protein